jgi:hypothetical protein
LERDRHLQDIKLLLAILVAAVLLGGYLYLQTLSDQAEREADRTIEGLHDAAARPLPDE